MRLRRPMRAVSRSTRVGGRRNVHCLDADGSAVLDDDLVDLGVASQIQIRVGGASGMDVGMGAVTAASGLVQSA